MIERVSIYPDGGIKKTESTVARIAGYIVNEELLPKKTMLLCVPAFIRGVEEDLVMAEDFPTIVLDCHEESCGTKFLYICGITPAARIFIPEIAEAAELTCGGSSRRELEPQAYKLAELVAQKTSQVASAMLENPSYPFTPQRIAKSTVLAPDDLPDDPFNYVKMEGGIFRPESMPDFGVKEEI